MKNNSKIKKILEIFPGVKIHSITNIAAKPRFYLIRLYLVYKFFFILDDV